MPDEMVIFTRTYDLLQWLLPKAESFPRLYRSTVTQRLMDAALNLQESLIDARGQAGPARIEHLRRADACLGRLRLYLRLAYDWRWINAGQYQHVSAMIAEIGRLLGGWIKAACGFCMRPAVCTSGEACPRGPDPAAPSLSLRRVPEAVAAGPYWEPSL